MIASVVLLALIGFSPLGNLLLYSLESRFPPWDAARGAPDGIIILGGSIDPDISLAHGTPVIRNAADRIVAAAALARKYPNARIVFTGGSANLISNEAREADFAARDPGKPRHPQIAPDHRTAVAQHAGERRIHQGAGVTEARRTLASGDLGYHMPRSVGLFRKAGFPVEPYPVDWRIGGRDGLFGFTNIAADGLSKNRHRDARMDGPDCLSVSGKTDELLPGPEAP